MSPDWTPYGIATLAMFLSERDIAILENLERFRVLSTRQLQRLHFPAVPFGEHTTASSATRSTTRVLARLEQRGVIDRLERRIGGAKHGSSASLWQLAATGDRFLRARRGDPDRRRFIEPSQWFTLHTLAVADLAITLIEQARLGRLELLELETEPTVWREYHGASGRQVLKPDLLAVTADAATETHSFIEVDRATENLPTVLRKARAYHAYWRSGAEQTSRELFPAVVWVTPSEARAQRIRDAIAGESTLAGPNYFATTTERALELLAPLSTSSPPERRETP